MCTLWITISAPAFTALSGKKEEKRIWEPWASSTRRGIPRLWQMRAMEAPVKRLRGRARFQVFCKLYARGPTPQVLAAMREIAARPVEGAQVFLEVDPANMI